MNERDPKLVALLFNEKINAQDLTSLSKLMTEEHTFIDSEGDIVEGKEKMIEAWKGFFEAYPDYQNIFTKVLSKDNLVILVGYSTCTYDPLDGPAIWTAKIKDNKVSEWRVYEENKKTRVELGLE